MDGLLEWSVIRTTLLLAGVSTVILLTIATPLAWYLARTDSAAAAFVSAIVSLPLVLPPTVLGFYLLIALGPRGPFSELLQQAGLQTLAFSFPGIVIGAVVHSLPFVVQPIQSSFAAIGDQPFEAAATLHASPLDRFITIALPLAAPGFLNAALLGFMHAIGEFGVILMIGGNIPGRTRVVSTAIFDHVESMNYTNAHMLAAIVAVFSVSALITIRLINQPQRRRR